MITFDSSELEFKRGNSSNNHITVLVFAKQLSKLKSVKTRSKLLGWLHAADDFDETIDEIKSLKTISFADVSVDDDIIELEIVDFEEA